MAIGSKFDTARLDRVGALCRRYVDEGKFPGTSVLVAHRGEVAYRDIYGLADIEAGRKLADDTIFRLYSMTKPIVSIALMQLVETGDVLLENPVSRYIPAFKDTRVYASGGPDDYQTTEADRETTVHDMLTHLSGLTYGFQTDPVSAIYRAHGMDFGFRGRNLEETCELLATLPLLFQPGTRWNYSASSDVVGRIVEVVSGQTLDDYFDEHIFGPLGMSDTAFWVPDDKVDRFAQCYVRQEDRTLLPFPGSYLKPPTMLSGSGGLVGTVDDYHRFCTALLNGGELDGNRIIGRKTLDYMTTNHLPGNQTLVDMGQSTFTEVAMDGMGFGLGFGIVLDPAANKSLCSPGEYMWGGAASTAFWVDPLEEISVVFCTQFLPSNAYPNRRQLRWVVNQALV
jgi:CubicO group peptidase (beta-lactamase class C family)